MGPTAPVPAYLVGLIFAASLSAASCSSGGEVSGAPLPQATAGGGQSAQGGSSPEPLAGTANGGGAAGGTAAGGIAAGGATVGGDTGGGGTASGGAPNGGGGQSGGTTPIVLGPKPNVLLIMIDDLNDWAGYLGGHPQARTPNLDALAKTSFAFQHAYANSPSCNPSRAAMMLGKHPNSTGLYANQYSNVPGRTGTIDMREYYRDRVTLPQYFKSQGYRTFRSGKVFHYFGDWLDPAQTIDGSFDVTNNGPVRVDPGTRWPLSGINWGTEKYIDWGAFDQPYADFEPYSRATVIEEELKKTQGQPFFMAAGFYLPHLPWYYPKSLLDEPALAHIKNVADVQLPKVLATDRDDMGAAAVTLANSADSKPKSLDGSVSYGSWHEAITANGKWKEAVQAYLASIYFVDLQLGRILRALENSPHAKNTIVALVGDHGWMLGEKGAWSKYKPWEDSVRTHFLIRVPGASGRRIDTPVGLVNLYRTLVDLAGLPEKSDTDGRSLRPLLETPNVKWDHPVVTAHLDWNLGWQSVRDERYRLIRFFKDGSEELYDHDVDPDEWQNLAGSAAYQEVKNRLGKFIPPKMTTLGSWAPATP